MISRNPKDGIAAGQRVADGVRIVMVGASISPTCGVRGYADGLTTALRARGATVTSVWWDRDPAKASAEDQRDFKLWGDELSKTLNRFAPTAVVLHYSVFTLSRRGIPRYVAQILRTIANSGTPLITVLHEYAYSWGRNGVRGFLWASTQRIALRRVVASSAGLLVTTPQREVWVSTRAWLPRRTVAVVPVFSNVPTIERTSPNKRDGDPDIVGVFGYSPDSTDFTAVLEALERLRSDGRHVTVELIGAPGQDSDAGRRWIDEARARGLEDNLTFTGVLTQRALAEALAACDVITFADIAGPTSRKTTLAAALASGRPVVALDGPQAFEPLVSAMAAVVVSEDSLADGIGALLENPDRAEEQGRRGRAFARSCLSADRVAESLLVLYREAVVR
mgnify:CR=1 FL=1